MDAEQLFLEHRDLARSIARHYARKYNRPFEEAMDHADFALVLLIYNGLEGYDPEQPPLRRWLGVKVFWHLKEVYHRGRHPGCTNLREREAIREQPASNSIHEWERGAAVAPAAFQARPPGSWLRRLFQEVSEETAALLRIITHEAPEELLDEITPRRGRTPDMKLRNLRAYLIDVLDWSQDRVDRTFEEVVGCLT